MKHRLLIVALAGFGFAAFAGCAETKPVSEQDQVSTIPWNRPEKWEGQGGLGGFVGSQ